MTPAPPPADPPVPAPPKPNRSAMLRYAGVHAGYSVILFFCLFGAIDVILLSLFALGRHPQWSVTHTLAVTLTASVVYVVMRFALAGTAPGSPFASLPTSAGLIGEMEARLASMDVLTEYLKHGVASVHAYLSSQATPENLASMAALEKKLMAVAEMAAKVTSAGPAVAPPVPVPASTSTPVAPH